MLGVRQHEPVRLARKNPAFSKLVLGIQGGKPVVQSIVSACGTAAPP
jgi:hypothetical protein